MGAIRGLPVGLLLGTLLALSSAGDALADVLGVGGEFEQDCANLHPVPDTWYGRWAVIRTAEGPQYAGGETLTYAVASITKPADLDVSVTIDDPTIVLPTDWPMQPLGTHSSDVMRTTVVTSELPLGSSTWSIAFVDNRGDKWTLTYTVDVNDTCVPNVPPSPSPSPSPPRPPASSPSPTDVAAPETATSTPPGPEGTGTIPVVSVLAAVSLVALVASTTQRRRSRRQSRG